MERRVVGEHRIDSFAERRVCIERSVLDSVVDGRDILINDATRAEVEMSDLAIAHLSLGQSYGVARSVDERMRVFLHERVEKRFFRLADSVAVFFGVVAESVENDQCVHGFLQFFIYREYTQSLCVLFVDFFFCCV